MLRAARYAVFLALAALAAASPVRLQVEALLVGPDNSTKLVDYLEAAKRSIYAEVYVLTYREVAAALASAAGRGLDVKVVLSANVYGGVPEEARQLAAQMERSGVKVRWNGDFPNVHSKLYVIDNETVILGNLNPTASGLRSNRGVMLVIRNATLARQLAAVVLNDFRGLYPRYSYPGVVLSPVNSEEELSWLLSQPGTLYVAMEQIYMSSGLVPRILSHGQRYVVVQRTDAEIGAVTHEDLVAKVIVVGPYVYVGSINLGDYSIRRNREVGLLIENAELASRLRSLVLRWYGEAGGRVETEARQPVDTRRAADSPAPSRALPDMLPLLAFGAAVAMALALVLLLNRRGPRI